MDSTDITKIGVERIIVAIKNHDTYTLSELLQHISVDYIETDTTDKLLAIFLSCASTSKNTEAVPIILNKFSTTFPETYTQYTSYIFTIPLLTTEILDFVVKSIDKISFVEIVDDLIHFGSSVGMVEGCAKAYDVFGFQPFDVWKTLRDIALSRENYHIQEYCERIMRGVSSYADKPVWVKNFIDGPVPRESDLTLPQMETKPVESFNLEDIISKFNLGEAEKEKLDKILKEDPVTEEKLRHSVGVFLKRLEYQRDKGLFRILGPAHPWIKSSLEDLQLGGPRMFTDLSYNYDDEIDQHEPWFVGSCDTCFYKIRNKYWAFRIPAVWGGWKGCFCSCECARKGVPVDEHPSQIYIDYYEKMLLDYGIQDRIADINSTPDD